MITIRLPRKLKKKTLKSFMNPDYAKREKFINWFYSKLDNIYEKKLRIERLNKIKNKKP